MMLTCDSARLFRVVRFAPSLTAALLCTIAGGRDAVAQTSIATPAATPAPAARRSLNPSAASSSSYSQPAETEASRARQQSDRTLSESIDLIEREYFDASVSREELIEAALRGIVDHLNRRAARAGQPSANAVLTRRDMIRVAESMAGEVTGIGVLAKPSADGIDVLQVFENSPAGKAGLKPGDRIVAANDQPLTTQAGIDAFALLRGEDGTPVRLSIRRPAGTAVSTLELRMTRGKYRVPTVAFRLLDDDIGYLQVAGFTRGTAEEARSRVLDHREGMWGLILDLRGNPGGALEEAAQVASIFLEPGKPLVQIQTRSSAQVLSSEGEVLLPGPSPMVVLVDGGTASAAEVLASALQTTQRAFLIGERTAGRGLGESIFSLPSGGGLRLATARYASPLGDSWIQRGLVPDQQVLAMALDPADDPQLSSALRMMKMMRPGRPLVAPNSMDFPPNVPVDIKVLRK